MTDGCRDIFPLNLAAKEKHAIQFMRSSLSLLKEAMIWHQYPAFRKMGKLLGKL
jgi:hypothetical protein